MSALRSTIVATCILFISGFRRQEVHEAHRLEHTPVQPRADVTVAGSPSMSPTANAHSGSLLSTAESWAGWRMLQIPFVARRYQQRRPFAAPDVAHLRSGSPPAQLPRSGFTKLEARRRIQNSEPERPRGLAKVTVNCLHNGATSVLIPRDWTQLLELDAEENIEVFASSSGLQRFRAQLRCDPTFRVEVVGRRSADPDVRRELYISRRVSNAHKARGLLSGQSLTGVVPLLEAVEVGGWTFVLRCVADGDLEDHMMRGLFVASGSSFSQLHQGLLALVGILRGLRTLASLGIIHNAISCDRVAYTRDTAFIFDLSTACMMHDGDVGLRCCDTVDGMGTVAQPAHYQAPEMTHGVPTGPENDVWAAGMFFLEMCCGTSPTRTLWLEDDDEDFDFRPENRDEVRTLIREQFDLKDVAEYYTLPRPVRTLLKGMLRKDPAKRLTARAALERAVVAAVELGLPVPEVTGLRLVPDTCKVLFD